MDRIAEQFEAALKREAADTEVLRVSALAGLFVALTVLLLPIGFLEPPGEGPAVSGREFVAIVLSHVGVVAYALLARRKLVRLRDSGQGLPPAWPVLNTTVEVSVATLFLVVAAGVVDPIAAFMGPLTFLYMASIVMAALHLDGRVCLYAGALASVQYSVLVASAWPSVLLTYGPDAAIAGRGGFLLRALSFTLVGALAGLLAREIKNRTRRAFDESAERRRLLDLFGRQVSPEVVDKLLAQASPMEGELRSVCVMFLDIRDFTSFSEDRSPREVVDYLNTLFDSLIDGINDHRGIVNKFLGDGFMAVFGAPVSDGQDCRNAVAAALDLVERVDVLVQSGRVPPTRIGIGLHVGEVVTGNVGYHLRREYTVIGDVVNKASRIEALNKRFASQVLVSKAVLDALEASPAGAEAMEPVEVRGRAEPVVVWRLA